MEIGGNGIGKESLFHRRHGNPPQKAATSMAHIKDHPVLSGLTKGGFRFARFDLLIGKPGMEMGIDITRRELAGHEFTEGTLSMINSKVAHDRDMGDRSRLDSAFNRRPFRAGV